MVLKVKTVAVPCLLCCLMWDLGSCLFYNAHTDAGTITGKIEKVFHKRKSYKIVSFLGIPYAEEITQWTRFNKLRLRESFQRPYNATSFRPACLQTGPGSWSGRTSEDCLFLNIYAPVESTINPLKKFPVLIYIHDGDFRVGAGDSVSPEILTVAGDLIVVTFNYRLGVFGFLSSGNDFAPGNYGLWDQHLAIRWIRYNIASFGGDVGNITIMGQSAGAASAMYQALYAGNRGLFQRMIAVSGTCLSPWALRGSNLREVAERLQCLNNDTLFSFSDEPLLQCIKNKPATDILDAGLGSHIFGPTIDGEFVTTHPYHILNLKNNTYEDANSFFRSLDIVLGISNNDGSQVLFSLLTEEQEFPATEAFSSMSDEVEEVIVPKLLEPIFRQKELVRNYSIDLQTRRNVLHTTLFQYHNWTDPEFKQNVKENLLQLSTDVNYVIPVVQVADAHSYTNNNSRTFVFQFVHTPSFNVMASRAGYETVALFLFGFPLKMADGLGLTQELIPKAELDLADNSMRWIANFARTGNPNKPSPLVGYNDTNVLWPKYSDKRSYLQISANLTQQSSPRTRFGEPATSFWTTLVPVFLHGAKQPDHTYSNYGVTVFTAFKIPSEKIEVVLVSLVLVSGGLLAISVLLLICACKFYVHK